MTNETEEFKERLMSTQCSVERAKAVLDNECLSDAGASIIANTLLECSDVLDELISMNQLNDKYEALDYIVRMNEGR